MTLLVKHAVGLIGVYFVVLSTYDYRHEYDYEYVM